MKKLSIVCAVVFSFSFFQMEAQRSDWKDGSNEINIGIKPFHFGPTSLMYKSKIYNKTWMRIGITDLKIWDGESGVRIGVEKQRNLALRTRLIYGIDAGTYFDYDKVDNSFAEYSVDLGIPLGVQFHLTKRIVFGIESRPSIGIYESIISEDGGPRETNFRTGVDVFNGLKGTLGYRF